MSGPLIFTHVPKTAGTSLKKSAIFPNVRRGEVYDIHGVRKLIEDRPQDMAVVLGHFPYGSHVFMGSGPFRYLTILRDPVDRAVSFYNYVLLCEQGNPAHGADHRWHPALPDAKRHAIDAFYELEAYRNVQAKFAAGYAWHRPRNALPPWLRGVVASEKRLLTRAQSNLLERYWYFGFLDRIEEAQDIIAAALGGTSRNTRDRSRQTSGAPGLVQPTAAQRDRIRELNALDVAFYEFALAHYDRQPAVVAHRATTPGAAASSP